MRISYTIFDSAPQSPAIFAGLGPIRSAPFNQERVGIVRQSGDLVPEASTGDTSATRRLRFALDIRPPIERAPAGSQRRAHEGAAHQRRHTAATVAIRRAICRAAWRTMSCIDSF